MNIKQAIQKLSGAGSSVALCLAKVVAINGSLLDAEPLDGSATILDLRLLSEGEKGLLLTPKIGSLIGCIFEGGVGFVVLFSELEKLEVSVGNQKIEVLDEKISISGSLAVFSELADLKSCINELIDLITQLQFINPIVGSSSLLPIFIPQLELLKTKFNSFLAPV